MNTHTAEQVAAEVDKIRLKLKMGPRPSLSIQRWFSTGSEVLDLAVNRGLPGGRLVEISGPEGCGKSTLALDIVREAQLLGGRGDYFDLEAGATAGLVGDMARVSTDPLQWELWRPPTAEDAFTAIDDLIPAVGCLRKPCVIVLDSVPAIVPEAEHNAPYGEDAQLAGIARLLQKFCRRNMVKLDTYPDVLVILINHVSTPFKAGMFEKQTYQTPGGRAMRYYPSVRLRFDKGGGVDVIEPAKPTKGEPKGDADKGVVKTIARERMKIVVWKNRLGSSHRQVTIPLSFVRDRSTGTTKGFDDARGVLEFLRNERVLLNHKGENGGTTAYWYLDGRPDDRRMWRQWVLAYNTDEDAREMLKDVLMLAAAKKWAPDEDLDEEFGESTNMLHDSLPA
jgi:RecA/RadA recombinase